jgi:hypothetical protein
MSDAKAGSGDDDGFVFESVHDGVGMVGWIFRYRRSSGTMASMSILKGEAGNPARLKRFTSGTLDQA